MRDTDIDPLAPDLRALLASERAHPAPSQEGKARVAAKHDAMLLPPGGGSGGSGDAPRPPPAPPVAAPLTRTIAVFVAGAIAGGVLVVALREPRVKIVERVVTAPVETTITSQTSSAYAPQATHPPALASAEPSASAAPTSSAGASPPKGTDSLAAERALLDPARTALGRSDGASALGAVRKHESQFASGKLAEEREAIAVQALVISHRMDEARARAAEFQQRYPGSVLGPSVTAALESAP